MSAEILIPKESRDAAIDRVVRFIHACRPGRRLRVTICEDRAERSDPQNRALFGHAYPVLMAHIGLRSDREKDELHEAFCGMYFGWVEYRIMGVRKKRPKRTTTADENGKRSVMDTLWFMDFFEFVRKERAAVRPGSGVGECAADVSAIYRDGREMMLLAGHFSSPRRAQRLGIRAPAAPSRIRGAIERHCDGAVLSAQLSNDRALRTPQQCLARLPVVERVVPDERWRLELNTGRHRGARLGNLLLGTLQRLPAPRHEPLDGLGNIVGHRPLARLKIAPRSLGDAADQLGRLGGGKKQQATKRLQSCRGHGLFIFGVAGLALLVIENREHRPVVYVAIVVAPDSRLPVGIREQAVFAGIIPMAWSVYVQGWQAVVGFLCKLIDAREMLIRILAVTRGILSQQVVARRDVVARIVRHIMAVAQINGVIRSALRADSIGSVFDRTVIDRVEFVPAVASTNASDAELDDPFLKQGLNGIEIGFVGERGDEVSTANASIVPVATSIESGDLCRVANRLELCSVHLSLLESGPARLLPDVRMIVPKSEQVKYRPSAGSCPQFEGATVRA